MLCGKHGVGFLAVGKWLWVGSRPWQVGMQHAWLVPHIPQNPGCCDGPRPAHTVVFSAQRSEASPKSNSQNSYQCWVLKFKSEQDRMPSAFGNAQSCGEGAGL